MFANIAKYLFCLVTVIFLVFVGMQKDDSVHAALPSSTIRFAVIGDYGYAGQAESDVASLIKSWSPDFIVTLGDNDYHLTGPVSPPTIDANIGQYFHEYIYPYKGSYGSGATVNRFFPALGNHDWDTLGAQPYLHYFTLPGNERYYNFTKGSIEFFVLDSDPREPDGVTPTSVQGTWLQQSLADSDTPWQFITMHHAPYSSSSAHGSNVVMQWDYQDWGADAVMAGHDHTYERLLIDNIPYFVNGLGGYSIYGFGEPLAESLFRYNGNYGAMLVSATDTQLVFQFYSIDGILIDEYVVKTTFADVPKNYWAWSYIDRLYASGVTTGCSSSPTSYCPTGKVTRAQMAIFLLRGIYGSAYTPPPVGDDTGFNDVSIDHWAAAWIKQLALEGITTGCGENLFCPNDYVSRDQMSILLLRAKYSSSYSPPDVGLSTEFSDVNTSHWAAAWIKQLATEGITSGCGGGKYCPNTIVTRDQMAVFLVKTFSLP